MYMHVVAIDNLAPQQHGSCSMWWRYRCTKCVFQPIYFCIVTLKMLTTTKWTYAVA